MAHYSLLYHCANRLPTNEKIITLRCIIVRIVVTWWNFLDERLPCTDDCSKEEVHFFAIQLPSEFGFVHETLKQANKHLLSNYQNRSWFCWHGWWAFVSSIFLLVSPLSIFFLSLFSLFSFFPCRPPCTTTLFRSAAGRAGGVRRRGGQVVCRTPRCRGARGGRRVPPPRPQRLLRRRWQSPEVGLADGCSRSSWADRGARATAARRTFRLLSRGQAKAGLGRLRTPWGATKGGSSDSC